MTEHDAGTRTLRLLALLAVLALAGAAARAADAPDKPPLKPEELEQLLAPVALYPDSLLTQVFMASTYPLEIVQADRWVKDHKDLKGDGLAKELEKQTWDPSVKSIVNFPDVLVMMSEKLDLTIKLGDAFIAQQADVLNTVQNLRAKAQKSGNLPSNEQQKVIVEAAPPAPPPSADVQIAPPPQVIKIESPNPQVIYVPTYNPVVVYGTWPYPAYPPYPYYPPRPPGYVVGPVVSFGVGVACGVAWGYAWGHTNWGHNNIDINVNRNTNFNTNINRNNYNKVNVNNANINNVKGGSSWQHDPAHRQGVAYPNQNTAQKFGGANQSAQAAQARDAYRGRADTGRQDLATGGASQFKANPGATGAGGFNRPTPAVQNNIGSGAANRPTPAVQNNVGSNSFNRPSSPSASRSSAFDGAGSSGRAATAASQRGSASRSGGSGAARGGGGRGR